MKLDKIAFWKFSLATLICIFSSSVAVAAYTGTCSTPADVSELPPGHWCKVLNSNARTVEKSPKEWDDWNGSSSAKYSSYQGKMGFKAIMENWSGAAFDSLRDRLIVMGGGHAGYAGNEIIAFSLKTLKWERITDPTPFPVANTIKNAGPPPTPTSRHTYGGIEYIASSDKLFIFGGSVYNSGSAVGGVWTFDLSAAAQGNPITNSKYWSQRSDKNAPPAGLDDFAVYDPITDRVFFHKTSSPGLLGSFHDATDTWASHSSTGHLPTTFAVINPIEHKLYEFNTLNGTNLRKWDIPDNPITSMSYVDIKTGGDTTMNTADDPGIAFDTAKEKIVAYYGGTSVYVFDSDKNIWTKYPAASTNLADPGRVTAAGGIFGRFRYSSNLNVYVYVDSVDSDVYLYKLAPDPLRPSAPVLY